MKYEFVRVTDEYKANENNFYIDQNDGMVTLKIESLLERNSGLKWPIALFVNGVLVEPKLYKFDSNNKWIKFEYDVVRQTDETSLIFTSNSEKRSKFIGQLGLTQFEKVDVDKIRIPDGFALPINNDLLGIFINGVLYDSDSFTISEQIITFANYCPDYKDNVAFLYYK